VIACIRIVSKIKRKKFLLFTDSTYPDVTGARQFQLTLLLQRERKGYKIQAPVCKTPESLMGSHSMEMDNL
jgi:hypothetical protein